MNQRQINRIKEKIIKLEAELNQLIQRYNNLYRDKPFGYKIRAAVLKHQIFTVNGELAAWRAKLDAED
jgi:hypothetical protein